MAAGKGNLMKLKIGDGASSESFSTIAGIRGKTLNGEHSPIDVTTDDDVSSGVTFRQYITGVGEMGIEADGVLTQQAGFAQLMNLLRAGTSRNFQVLITGYGTVSGAYRVAAVSPGATYDDTMTFSLRLVNAGPWSFSSTAVT